MRAQEFISERETVPFQGIDMSLTVEKDDDYVDDDDADNQLIHVRAMSGGRELGHVLFTQDYDSQGLVLNPQDLEVDERYRGQGIAAAMYDYVKSLGYKIRRSGQQTDAGAGFWAKHRPDSNVWEQGVTEAKARYEMTDLDPWTFDQTPAGWRGLPSSARQADALNQYIDRYVKDGQFVGAPQGVKTVKPYILYWHLGQVLTQMGRNAMASRVMRQALDDSDPNWNAYVMATISFLKKDRKDFDHWAPLARGNEETIKRLTNGWGRPYKQAYAGQQGVTEVKILSKVKGKGSEPGQLPRYGRPIGPGEETRYLGTKVADWQGREIWRDYLGGQLSYHLFDPDTRIVIVTTFGSRYKMNPRSYIIHGLYAAPGNPVGAAEFYRGLVRDLGLTLISDRKQSPGGNRVWQQLEQFPDVEVYGYDTKTDQALNFGAGDVEMYTVPSAAVAGSKEMQRVARDLRLVATARSQR